MKEFPSEETKLNVLKGCPEARIVYKDIICLKKWRQPNNPKVNCIVSRSMDCPLWRKLEEFRVES